MSVEFASLLQQIRESSPPVAQVDETWAQGRATFGGLVAALLYEAMRNQVPHERLIRSFALSFVGPAGPGVQTYRAQALRSGKAVTQMEARLLQEDHTMAVALASFGAGRESAVVAPGHPMPEAPTADDCQVLPFVEGISPEFIRHLEMRWVFGELPFSGSSQRQMGGWMRFRKPQGEHLTDAHLLALVDTWPPVTLPMLKQRAPASSLSWAMEFIQPLPPLPSDAWLLYRAEVDQARDGYSQGRACIWSPDGQLLAVSQQPVTIFG
ncbi:MAG: thioesterase family protein [Ectothiorhodospiraceae bacterium]|nr:thioesterase family protein [Ectothiorhodospiraceae bacterium]